MGGYEKTIGNLCRICFIWHFALSSCKRCDKNKGKDNSKNNPVTDRDKNLPALNGSDLTEIGRYLKGKDASDTEIRAMMNIEKEDFGEGIGHIVQQGSHYVYRDSRGVDHDGLQTTNSCGLYAVKRLLFVLGKHNIVSKDLWYRHTDQELRNKFAAMPGGEKSASEGKCIDPVYIAKLMVAISVPIKYCYVMIGSVKLELEYVAGPFLTKKQLDWAVAKINEKVPGYKKIVEDIQSQAQQQLDIAKQEMVKVRDEEATDVAVRKTAKAKVIDAAELVTQVRAQIVAVSLDARPLANILDMNRQLGGSEPPHLNILTFDKQMI